MSMRAPPRGLRFQEAGSADPGRVEPLPYFCADAARLFGRFMAGGVLCAMLFQNLTIFGSNRRVCNS